MILVEWLFSFFSRFHLHFFYYTSIDNRPLAGRMADSGKGETDGDMSPCNEDSFSPEIPENCRSPINGKNKVNSFMKNFRESIRRAGGLKNKESDSKTTGGNYLGYFSDNALQSPTTPSK